MKREFVIICLQVALLVTPVQGGTAPECDNCRCCKYDICNNYLHNIQCTYGCKDGYGNSGCRYRCPTGCTVCSWTLGVATCSSCKSGYFKSWTKCERCPTGCSTCSSYSNCLTCNSDYYFQYYSIWSYTYGQCIACHYGFYRYQRASTCTGECPPGCFICSAADRCSVCKNGYYSFQGYLTCTATCPTKCVSCSSSSVCEICQPGFYNSDSSKDCSLLCPSSCSACRSATYCTSCKDGHWRDGTGQCIRCQDGCASCTSSRYCFKCTLGFYMDVKLNCQACPTGCSSCTGKYVCSECRSGFTGTLCDSCIATKYGTDCDQNCPANCHKCTSSTNCQQCYNGFNGTLCDSCVKGKFGINCDQDCPENCHKCTSNTNCQQCYNGFNGTLCDSCAEGKHGVDCDQDCPKTCHTCSSSFNCELCHNGYYNGISSHEDNVVYNDCRNSCPESCTACTSYTKCTACKSDLHKGETCEECVDGRYGEFCTISCPLNCLDRTCKRDSGHCNTCVDGKHGDTCNENCPSNCKTCSSVSMCESCIDGFYNEVSSRDVTDMICLDHCPSNCTSCSSFSLCTACKTDYEGDVCEKCVNGKYGADCYYWCSDDCFNNFCDRDTGHCLSCPPGVAGEICDRCEDGKHGTNCDLPCSGNCNNNTCERNTGYCTDGCINDNLHGDTCDKCTPGFYNVTCLTPCPANCKNNTCEKSDGRCIYGCRDGYGGDHCNYCANGRYGDDCNMTCPTNCLNSTCASQSGKCETCEIGFYGNNCTDQCSMWCQNGTCQQDNGTCSDGCKSGYSGDRCCTEGDNCHTCSSNGICSSCMSGWYGDKCDMVCSTNCLNSKCDSQSGNCASCEDGFYGNNCTDQCSTWCQNGTCLQDNGTCSDGCNAGFSGDRCCTEGDNCHTCSSNVNCTTCMPGWYGDQCKQPCPENCTDDGCRMNDGECFHCNGQSYGANCENECPFNCLQDDTASRCVEKTGLCIGQCVQGYHGGKCDKPCSSRCINMTCSKDGATCLLGCIEGQTGINCPEEEKESGSSTTAIVLALLVLILIFITVVVGLVIWKRGRGGGNQKDDVPVRNSQESGTVMEMSGLRTSHRGSQHDRVEGHMSIEYRLPIESRVRIESNVPIESHVPTDVPGHLGEEDETVDDVIGDDIDDFATYANVGSVRKRIAVELLWEYVTTTPDSDFADEFKVLPKGLINDFAVSVLPQNNARNRYKNVYPYDENRVKLTGASSDYINASYINGNSKERAYIASLGPTRAVMEKFEIFWDMVWQENVEKIVMLTNLIENRHMKCEQYWPDVNSTLTYGRVTVTNLHEKVNADYVVRSLSVALGTQKRTVFHAHFTAWPDKDVPDHVTSIVEFHNRVKSLKHELSGPIIVHCSAGIGRTGTYIALDILSDEGEATGQVDIFNCVMALRHQRVNMVQTEKQYVYLHRAVAHNLTFASQPIRATEFQQATTKTTNQDFDQKFQRLAETMERATEGEKLTRNRNKTFTELNRKDADIPGDRYRVRLFEFQTCGDHDFINAVYINSFRTSNRFIAAQTPLPATVQDFVKMILQARCTCVVNLEPETLRSKTIGKYLPPDNQTVTHGQFQLSSTKLISPEAYTVRQVIIRNTERETMIHCFQFNAWPSKETVPKDPTGFVRFIKDVTDKAKELEVEGDRSAILLHCLSGATKCGLFCAVHNAIEKMDSEQEVSVENIMRQIQARRRTAFPNQEQLALCYKAVSAYLELSNTYSNFELQRQ